jgi:PTH1 family peptidyl-tRNA hydrolase
MIVKLIVGLGNPGLKYQDTRHNIGQSLLEHFSICGPLQWTQKFKGSLSQFNFPGGKILFLIPQTYMNLSGESVAPAVNFYKINLKDLLIIHDELDLPFGTFQFKLSGGLAGHNGLKSIAQHLSSQDFCRLRIGIGRPSAQTIGVSDYVLSKFNSLEHNLLKDQFIKLDDALKDYIDFGIEKTTQKYNQKIKIK